MFLSRRSARAVFALIVAMSLLSACLGDSNSDRITPTATEEPTASPTATEEPTPEPSETGGTLIIGIPNEPDTLNFTLTDSVSALRVISVLDSRLIRIRSDGDYEAQLLEQVPTVENNGVSPDGLVWTLNFKPELAWSDGETLDANDFLFTWNTITSSGYPAINPDGWNLIQRISLSNGSLTATVHLREASPAFLDDVLAGASENGGGLLLPEHLFEDMSISEISSSGYGDENRISNGPFTLGDWDDGEQIILERNEHFHGPEPRLERIIFRFLNEPQEATDFLTTGEIDLGINFSETALIELTQVPDVTMYLTPIPAGARMFGLNLNDPLDLTKPHPILSEPSIRRALVLGFNRDRLVNELFLGQTTVAVSPLDNSPWMNDALESYPYDPDAAEALLETEGWEVGDDGIREKDGVRLRLAHSTILGEDPGAAIHQRLQEAFIADMLEIGVEIIARNFTLEQFDAPFEEDGILATRQFDIVDLPPVSLWPVSEQLGWQFASLSIPTDKRAGGNLMGYRNSQVDMLLRQAAGTLDKTEQQKLLNEAQAEILEEIPVIPVYDQITINASQVYVQGLQPGAMSGLWWNPEDWWVDREAVTE